MSSAILVAVPIACASSKPAPAPVAIVEDHSDECEMIEAAMGIPDPAYQSYYRGEPGTREAARLPVVILKGLDLGAHPHRCHGPHYVLYSEELHSTLDRIVELGFERKGGVWRFWALCKGVPGGHARHDANGNPAGFDVSNFYCGGLTGNVWLRNGTWVASPEPDLPTFLPDAVKSSD